MELEAAAGIGVDISKFATKDDLLAFGDRLAKQLGDSYRQQILAAQSALTNAGGNVGFRVYDIPDGMQFYPSCYIIWSDAHNPSTGGNFQSTSCYGGIYHGIASPINIADYFPPPSGGLGEAATPNILPYIKRFGKHDSPEFQAPDNVFFGLVNGPATTNITCILYGWLEEVKQASKQAENARRKARRRGRTQLVKPAPMETLSGEAEHAYDPTPV